MVAESACAKCSGLSTTTYCIIYDVMSTIRHTADRVSTEAGLCRRQLNRQSPQHGSDFLSGPVCYRDVWRFDRPSLPKGQHAA